jgi:transcriptional regulator with XRE-family HTH domain
MAAKGQRFFEELGRRVRDLRTEQGLTQVQFAELLGISQQLVALYERGQHRMPMDLLPEVARLLGVSVEEVLGLSPQSARRGPTPKLQQQLERISRLPRAKQRLVMEMLDGVLSQAGQ